MTLTDSQFVTCTNSYTSLWLAHYLGMVSITLACRSIQSYSLTISVTGSECGMPSRVRLHEVFNLNKKNWHLPGSFGCKICKWWT